MGFGRHGGSHPLVCDGAAVMASSPSTGNQHQTWGGAGFAFRRPLPAAHQRQDRPAIGRAGFLWGCGHPLCTKQRAGASARVLCPHSHWLGVGAPLPSHRRAFRGSKLLRYSRAARHFIPRAGCRRARDHSDQLSGCCPIAGTNSLAHQPLVTAVAAAPVHRVRLSVSITCCINSASKRGQKIGKVCQNGGPRD